MSEPITPNLDDSQFVRIVAANRPCRHGGLRLETETLTHGAQSTHIFHHYGHGGCGVTLAFGTAAHVADLIAEVAPAEESTASSPSIAVLGAGVVGLTTAWTLAQRGYRVRIVTERMAADTTSQVAGALWAPTGIDMGDDDASMARFDALLHRSQSILRSLDPEHWAYQTLPVCEPEGAPDTPRLFATGAIDPPVPVERLPIGGPPRSGRVFMTEFIHTPRFLRVLADEVRQLGVSIDTATVRSPDDVSTLPESLVVNCLGLGSRDVFGDTAMYAARGVLVHMKPQQLGYIVHDGYRYMFPREDALILGGCFMPDADTDTHDATIAAEILAHHRAFFASNARVNA
ncbi:MAG: FAD-dependent oxidoreductase [Planctomycetota bacterium]